MAFPTNGLVHYWPMTGTGNTIADLAGSVDLVFEGYATPDNTLVPGKFQDARSWAGLTPASTDFIATAPQASAITYNDWSMSFWLYVPSGAPDEWGVAFNLSGGQTPARFHVEVNPAQTAMWVAYDAYNLLGTEVLPTGQYVHVVVTVNSATNIGYLYLNGASIGSTSLDSTGLRFGGSTGSVSNRLSILTPNSFSGRSMVVSVSDTAVWNRPLSASEVSDLWASGDGVVYGYTPVTPPANEQLVSDSISLYSELLDDSAVADTFLLQEATEQESVGPIEDTVLLSEAIHSESMTPVSDTFALGDAHSEVSEYRAVDRVSVSDEVRSAGSSSLAEVVFFSDAVVSTTSQFVIDSFGISNANAAVSSADLVISSAFRIADQTSASGGGVDLVADVINVSDEMRAASETLCEDSFSVRVTLSDRTERHQEVEDRFGLSSDLTTQVVRFDELGDTVTFSDAAFYKDPSATAWVMNTETAAPYWYSNWQFYDMVQVGDKVLAVGPEGLCVIGAGTDAGETIDAVLGYGFADFGTEQKKRVPEILFGYTAETPMGVTVETYGQGHPPYEYALSAQRLSEQPNNGRLTPGKGLNARYWRIEIHNTDGGAFSVNSITASLAVSSRRL